MSLLKTRLRELRKERKMTQKQVAALIGITESTYCGYETGKRQPDIQKIAELSKIFGVSSDYLLGNVSDPFFVLDNEKIKAEINSYEKDPEPSQTARPEVTDEDIKFALFGGAGEITDEMYDEVKEFVKFVKMKHGQ